MSLDHAVVVDGLRSSSPDAAWAKQVNDVLVEAHALDHGHLGELPVQAPGHPHGKLPAELVEIAFRLRYLVSKLPRCRKDSQTMRGYLEQKGVQFPAQISYGG